MKWWDLENLLSVLHFCSLNSLQAQKTKRKIRSLQVECETLVNWS